MLQIATFALPNEQTQANEFLATHKPSQQGVHFTDNHLIVFYDTGEFSNAHRIADLQELLQSVDASTFQMEVALYTMQSERDTLNPKNNKGRYDDLSAQITDVNHKLKLQKSKKEFVEGRIAELRNAK